MADPAQIIGGWVAQIGRDFKGWWDREGRPLYDTPPFVGLPAEISARLGADPYISGSRWRLAILNIAGIIGGMFGIMGRVAHSAWGQTFQQLDRVYRPNLINEGPLFEAFRRGDSAWDYVSGILALQGLPDDQIAVIKGTLLNELPAEPLMTLWRREKMTLAERDAALKRLGWSQDKIDKLALASDVWPGPSDALTMLRREAFEPDVVARFGLDDEWDKVDKTYLHAAGVQDEQGILWYRAGWQHISPTQAGQMLHRTTDRPIDSQSAEIALPSGRVVYRILGQEAYRELLRITDYPKVWRGRLEALTYEPFTRVDIRRAFKIGKVTEDDVYRNYLDLGYPPERAQVLLDFTKSDVSVERIQEKELLTGPLRSRATSLYLAGRLSAQDFRETLTSLRYQPAQIEAFITEAEFARRADQMDAIATAIQKQYVSRLASRETTEAWLAEHEFSEEERTRLFEVWDIQRATAELSAAQKEARDLTAAEITQGVVDFIIPEGEAQQLFEVLHYDAQEAAVKVAMAVYKRDQTLRKAEESRIQTLYTLGKLEYNDAALELDRVPVDTRRKAALLAQWTADREKRAPDVPITTLEQMVRRKTISTDDARTELAANGWDSKRIEWWLAFWEGRRIQAEDIAVGRAEKGTPLQPFQVRNGNANQ